MGWVAALLELFALVVVCVGGTLIYQIASLSTRVKDVERKLNELRAASVAERADRISTAPAPGSAAQRAIVVPSDDSAPIAPSATVRRRESPTPPPVERPSALPVAIASPIASRAAATAESSATAGKQWEILVGTNWLNKLGVLVFVMGVALLVRYSIAHVGPAGRIAIGFAASATLLAIGVVVARRERYRTFGSGLIAGGWAGVYFTAFAMHGIAAARVIDSDLLGTVLLLAVASAMVAHALFAKSESMTALSFVVGYATIVLSPLTMFAAAAIVPLAAATAIVAARFGWARVALLGAAATYAVFPIRDVLQMPMLIDRHSPALYAMLGLYWLVFETADILAEQHAEAPRGLEFFVVNVLGVLGVAVLEVPPDAAGLTASVLASGGLAYFVSAIVRTRLAQRNGRTVLGGERLTSTHLAIGASAALMALAAASRFDHARAMFVALFETELVLASGVLLKDRIVRRIALGLVGATSLYAIRIATQLAADSSWTDPALLQVAAVAIVWFADREWLRRKASGPLDYCYSWAGTVIGIVLIGTRTASIGNSLVLLAIGGALLEAGLRNRDDYRHQAYVVSALAAMWIVAYFLQVPRPIGVQSDAWRVLAPAAVIAGALAFHLSRSRDRMELRIAAMVAAWVTVGFVALLELSVMATGANGGAWAITAVALTTSGVLARSATLRWQGYLLASLGALSALGTDVSLASDQFPIWSSVGIAALYAVHLVTRRLWSTTGADETERAVREGMAGLATLLLFVLSFDRGGETRLTLDWGLAAIVLLTAGTMLRERTLRWCGLAGLFACVVRLALHDLAQLEAPARITAFVVLGLVLIGASWIYTRFRERLS